MSIYKKAARTLFHTFLLSAVIIILGCILISQNFSPSFNRYLDSFSTLSELRASNRPAKQTIKMQVQAHPVKDYATDDQEDIASLVKHRKDYVNISKRLMNVAEPQPEELSAEDEYKKSELIHLRRIEKPVETVQLIAPKVQQIIQQVDDSSAGVAERIRQETRRGQIDYRENYERNLASEMNRLKEENDRLRRQVYDSSKNRNIVLRKKNQ